MNCKDKKVKCFLNIQGTTKIIDVIYNNKKTTKIEAGNMTNGSVFGKLRYQSLLEAVYGTEILGMRMGQRFSGWRDEDYDKAVTDKDLFYQKNIQRSFSK